MAKSKSLSTRVASLLVEMQALNDQQKAANEQQRKNQAVFDKRSEEVTELRKEIGALKKKNFTLQEDAKKSKSSFEAKIEEREKLIHGRPAFETAEPTATKKETPTATAPVATPAPVAAPAPVSAKADEELVRKVEALAADNASLSAKVGELIAAAREGNGELRKLKRRIDDYRRADSVTKGKMDVLTDKLGTLGRRYYDAVSELAHLKGEVGPTTRELGIEVSQASEAPAFTSSESSEDEQSQAERN